MFCTQFFCIVYYCILHTQKRHVCASISGKAEGLPTKPHLQLLHGFSKVPCLRPEGRSWPVDHVEIAAHPNSARFGIFEYPRQVNISLGTFTSLGNLLNLNRERKKKKHELLPLLPAGMDLGWFLSKQKMPTKKKHIICKSEVNLSIDLCHWGFRPHQELFASGEVSPEKGLTGNPWKI